MDDAAVYFASEERFRPDIERRFARLKARLEALVPEAEVHHVGSTAVPRSLTKGDLDVQVRVSAAAFEQARERLSGLFEVNEGGFSGPDVVSFDDRSSEPSAGIHLTVIGGASDVQWKFRDCLLASDALRRQYDDLKRRFDGGSMDAYREAKAEFVSRVLSTGK